MTLNAARKIGYVDDGVYDYACLACSARWAARSEPGPFCSYCGTRWTLPMIIAEPERLRDLVPAPAWPELRCWTIEHRVRFETEWTPWTEVDAATGSAHNAYRVLTERRQRAAASAEDAWTDTWAEEFRVRRARRTTVCPGCRRRDHATDPCPEANHAV